MDFFAGLLDRSLQQGNILQRRRPSRFEPVPPPTVRDGIGQAAIEDIEHDESKPDSHPTSRFHDDRPRTDQSGTIQHHETEPGNQGDGFHDRHAHDFSRDSHVPQTARSQVEIELARLAQRVAELGQAGRNQPKAEPSAAVAHVRQITRPTVIPQAIPAALKTKAEDRQSAEQPLMVPGKPGRHLRAESMVEPETGPDALRQVQPAPAIKPLPPLPKQSPAESRQYSEKSREPGASVITPQHKPMLQPMLPPMPRPAATTTTARRIIAAPVTPAPTTVHVNIGRIEIRAVTQPAKAARSSQPVAPTLSLDDYLRTRNGGSR